MMPPCWMCQLGCIHIGTYRAGTPLAGFVGERGIWAGLEGKLADQVRNRQLGLRR